MKKINLKDKKRIIDSFYTDLVIIHEMMEDFTTRYLSEGTDEHPMDFLNENINILIDNLLETTEGVYSDEARWDILTLKYPDSMLIDCGLKLLILKNYVDNL